MADAIDGVRLNQPTQTRFADIRLWHLHKKDFFRSGRDDFWSEVNTWAYIGLACQGIFVATREY